MLAGLYSSLQTFSLQQHTFDLRREGQVTDRFTKAIDQLGAVETGPDGKPKINLEVRLGGIYALERIARDSPTDHWTIIEVLSTYVRENSPANNYAETKWAPRKLRADIQAILKVIGRRDITHDPPHRWVDLSRTDLSHADLNDAELSGAELSQADLSRTDLIDADLSRADLSDANLIDADLVQAELGTADTGEADLSGADLSNATGVDQEQLNAARGNKNTKLPEGLTRPASWH